MKAQRTLSNKHKFNFRFKVVYFRRRWYSLEWRHAGYGLDNTGATRFIAASEMTVTTQPPCAIRYSKQYRYILVCVIRWKINVRTPSYVNQLQFAIIRIEGSYCEPEGNIKERNSNMYVAFCFDGVIFSTLVRKARRVKIPT